MPSKHVLLRPQQLPPPTQNPSTKSMITPFKFGGGGVKWSICVYVVQVAIVRCCFAPPSRQNIQDRFLVNF